MVKGIECVELQLKTRFFRNGKTFGQRRIAIDFARRAYGVAWRSAIVPIQRLRESSVGCAGGIVGAKPLRVRFMEASRSAIDVGPPRISNETEGSPNAKMAWIPRRTHHAVAY